MIFLSIFLSFLTLGLLTIWSDSLSKFAAIPAVLALIMAFLRMSIALKHSQNLDEEHKLARTDELTGIANRRSLLAKLNDAEFGPTHCMLLLDLDSFKERELVQAFKDLRMENWNGASWPPNVVPRALWEKVGGYSDEFSPGMYSDPDFSMKLWAEGVRYFKGIGESKVYHFMSKSTGKISKNDGRKTFMQKWKISPGYFYKKMLKMGKKWEGPLKTPFKGILFTAMKLKVIYKSLF